MGSEVRVCTVAQTHDHHLCPVRAKVSCPVSLSLHCEPQSPSLENQSRSEQPLNQETRLPSVKTGARSSSLLLSHLFNVALFLQPSLSQSTLCILSTSCVTHVKSLTHLDIITIFDSSGILKIGSGPPFSEHAEVDAAR